MTQFNLDDPIDPDTKSGSVLATDLSTWRDAIHTSHDGTSRPSYAKTGMIWANFTPTNPVVYMVDGGSDIVLGVINNATGRFIPGADAATVFSDIKQAATVSATGVAEQATNSEALGGSDTTRFVTSAGLASSKLYAVEGYQELPGGLIIQWGVTAGNSGVQTESFASTFTTVYSCTLTPIQDTSNGRMGYLRTLSVSGFTAEVRSDGGSAVAAPMYYMAIGV